MMHVTRMPQPAPASFIVRILGRDGQPAGVGMLVAERRIMTCAHVVNTALGRSSGEQGKPDGVVKVDFPLAAPDRDPVRATVAAWLAPPQAGTAGEDIAGLELVEGDETPTGTEPGHLAVEVPRPGRELQVFGYPGDPPRPDGVFVTATIRGQVGRGRLQLDSGQYSAHRVQPGFSGSPVFDEGIGRVVGLIAESSPRHAPQRDSYAIGADQLRLAWPEVLAAPTAVRPDFRGPVPAAPTPGLLPGAYAQAGPDGRNEPEAKVAHDPQQQLLSREAIHEYREDLSRLAELERGAKEWGRENRHEDYLFRGDRLVKAQLAAAKYPEQLAKLSTAVQQLIIDFLGQSMPSQQLKVFLCHSSSDKPTVRRLYQQLRAVNVLPWLDERDILPGQDWDLEIRLAIRASQAIIVCLSERAVTKRGYVQKEIKNALDIADEQPEGAIFLIPLRLEPCEVPDRLRRWQWVDLFQQDGFEQLARTLRKLAKPGL
jgi:TIR domain-containing protein/trypsin-like peptidase